MLTRRTSFKWSRILRKRPPCTAASHEGLIRRKDKIESGRPRRSEPPTSVRFATTPYMLQEEPSPSQAPTMHSGAKRGPYSPKSQNCFRSAPMVRATRVSSFSLAHTAPRGVCTRMAPFVGPEVCHKAALFDKKTKSIPVCTNGASHPHRSALPSPY